MKDAALAVRIGQHAKDKDFNRFIARRARRSKESQPVASAEQAVRTAAMFGAKVIKK